MKWASAQDLANRAPSLVRCERWLGSFVADRVCSMLIPVFLLWDLSRLSRTSSISDFRVLWAWFYLSVYCLREYVYMWMGVVRMCVDMYFPQCVCGGWRQPPGVVLFFYSGIWGSILGHTAYKPFYPEDFYLVSPARILFVRLIFSYLNSSNHFFVCLTNEGSAWNAR